MPTSTAFSGSGPCGVCRCCRARIRWRRGAAAAAVVAASVRHTISGQPRLQVSWRASPLITRQRLERRNGDSPEGACCRRPFKSERQQWAAAAPVDFGYSALLERAPAKSGGDGGGACRRRPRGNDGQQRVAAALVSLDAKASNSWDGFHEHRDVAGLEAFGLAGTRGCDRVDSSILRPG